MGRFLLRRALFAVILVGASSSAALLLTRLAPGDLTARLGPEASVSDIAATRARYGLDRNPLEQLALWAGRAARFDFGESFLYRRPVAPLVLRAAMHTAILGVVALALATILGIGLGILTGSRRGGMLPAVVRTASILALSLPPLLTSLLLVFIAARTGWLPIGGMSSVAAIEQTGLAWLTDVVWHLPLPAIALALPMAATFERLQSRTMTETLHQPFIAAALARGVQRRRLILRHAWPVAAQPICAVYGLAIGALLSGSFVVEYVAAWPGIGRLMYEALRARDIYLVSGCAAMGALLLAIGTLAGDLLHAAADPRLAEDDDA